MENGGEEGRLVSQTIENEKETETVTSLWMLIRERTISDAMRRNKSSTKDKRQRKRKRYVDAEKQIERPSGGDVALRRDAER
jgi:hypothetical protein